MALPQLTLRTTKGSALTYAEADANFTNLSTGTIRVAVGSTTTTLALNDTITFSTGTGMTITANSATNTITFASSGGGGGITDIVNDTTPQLGGNLDVNGNSIVSTSNGSITMEPNGTGIVGLHASEVRVGDVDAAAYITSRGAGNLILGTNYSASTSSYITINHGVNANIDINPSGTGNINLNGDTVVIGDSGAIVTLSSNGAGDLFLTTNHLSGNFGYIRLYNGVNGDIDIQTDGTGDVNVNADTLRVGDTGAQATITTRGAGDLVLNTNSGTDSGSITIGNGASGNITIAADGTGDIHLNSNALRVGRNNATVAEIATAGTTPLKLYPNEGSSTQPFINLGEGANGAITIASTGSGNINLTTATGSVVIAGTTWPSSKGTNGYLLQTNGSGTASWVSTSTLGITLNTATASVLGGVKIGSGLSAAGDGTIAATGDTVYTGSTSTSGTITPYYSSGTVHTYTLTGNVTISALGNTPTSGQTVTLILTQDGTGGRTLTSTMKFAGGYKTLSTAPGAIDIMTISYIGTSYYASLAKGFA